MEISIKIKRSLIFLPSRLMPHTAAQTSSKALFAVSIISAFFTGCGDNTSSSVADPSARTTFKRQATFSTSTAGDYTTAVQQLYVSYFGRPADPGGLTNFSNALLNAKAPTDIQALSAAYNVNTAVRSLVDAFGTSAESNTLYPGDTTAFVTAIYRNVLSRAPDADGLGFWVSAINQGNLTKGNAALAIMAGALANKSPQGILDGALINKRIAVASNFTSTLVAFSLSDGYRGDPAAASARNMLSLVTKDTDSFMFQPTTNYTIGVITGTVPSDTNATTKTLANYTTISLDVFSASAVDTHSAVVGAIEQLSADTFTLTNAYWDFNRTGADRFRAGPQYLLKWDGMTFRDNSHLVEGGIPRMYFAETTGTTADINNDGSTDVVFGGNGPDGEGNVGEPSFVLLSSGHKYTIRQLPNGAAMPDRHSWVHGGTTVKLRNQNGRSIFLDDVAYGPSYLVDANSSTPTVQTGLLPSYLGSKTTSQWAFTADLVATASLGVDLDGDAFDELVVGTQFAYTAEETYPELNKMTTVILKQDGSGSFARSGLVPLPEGPFAKRSCWDNTIGGMKNDCGAVTIKKIASSDFNNDSKPDLLVTHHIYGKDATGAFYTGSYPQVLVNKGSLNFVDATLAYFGKDMADISGGYVHSYPFDLNNDRCVDIVFRGDANNLKKPRVFLNDCAGSMIEFTEDLHRLMPQTDQYNRMNGGIPIMLEGRPAIVLWHGIGTGYPVKFHVLRIPVNIPTPVNKQIVY